MIKVNVNLDKGVPQYACTSCSKCTSIYGKSLCKIKNRGCCWYFPKFNLHEIHMMSKTEEGLKTLEYILSLPNIKIYNYYIHAKGYFDEEGYNTYLNTEEAYENNVKDKTIFFRACPFVEDGVGCNLPEQYRSYVCNFFICEEITEKLSKSPAYKKYLDERNSYAKWIQWENESLEMILKEKNINLINHFKEVVEVLKEIPLENFVFAKLETIEII